MIPLEQVIIGWKGLQKIINRIIDHANASVPLEGDGIRIQETANGILISTANDAENVGPTAASSGQSAGQQQNHSTIDKIEWTGVKWQGVTVVDPSTCAQSTLTVLVKTDDPSDSILIGLTIPLWVDPQ